MGDFLIIRDIWRIIRLEQVLFHYPPYIMRPDVQSSNYQEQINKTKNPEWRQIDFFPEVQERTKWIGKIITLDSTILNEKASSAIVSFTIRGLDNVNQQIIISPFSEKARELDQATSVLADKEKNKLAANNEATNANVMEVMKRQIIRNDQITYANAA